MTTKNLESTTRAPATLSDWARRWSARLLQPAVRLLARLGFSPNSVTLIGLALNLGVALLLAKGLLLWGGILMLLAGLFDALDGSLARLTGRQTRFGAFLDSTLDRYSEALTLLGLMWFYLGTNSRIEVMLIAASLVGSILVSYTRARAEGLGLECKGGLLTRLERVIIISAALILGLVQPALWLVAILTNFTALQRIIYVWQATGRGTE